MVVLVVERHIIYLGGEMPNSGRIRIVVALIGALAVIGAACIAAMPLIIQILVSLTKGSSPNAPVPTSCRTGVLCEVFPDIDEGEIFTWADAPNGLTANFTPECARSGSYGLELSYGFVGDTDDGGWGVHWAKTAKGSLDMRRYTELVFWAKGETGREKFQVGMKDADGAETYVSLDTLLVNILDWTMAIVPLDKFRPVRVEAINNISFGFNNKHGFGKICIDDIALR
jgi:hypothetical protein